MIAKLSGKLDSVDLNQAVVDVGGVGYLVACSANTLRRVGGVGEAVSLLIETHVREDAISLYGFADSLERDWFRLLTTVQGVGAKSALAVLGIMPPDTLARAIASQDKAAITRADGVGPKLALRILTELKDKAANALIGAGAAGGGISGGKASPFGNAISEADKKLADAVSALANLGYARLDAFTAVSAAAVRLGAEAPLDAMIREGLAEMLRKAG